MKAIYLVISHNIENDKETSIINICSNREAALRLCKNYRENVYKSHYDHILDFYIEPVELSDNKDILWDYYDDV